MTHGPLRAENLYARLSDIRVSLVAVVATVVAAVMMFGGCAHSGSRPSTAGGDHLLAHASDAMTITTFANTVDSLRTQARIPGLSVIVMRDTSILLSRGMGVADVERGTAVTVNTPFNTASVSKPISAVVALRLVQDGKLTLDTPMRRFAGFAEYCESGRADGGIFFRDFACLGDALTMRHLLSMQSNSADGVPGSRFWYNPPAYSWASRPMAEVGGRAFSELVDEYVFKPAGMHDAARIHRRLPLRADLAERLAQPYHIDSSGRVVRSAPPPPQGDGAAGGVIASAMDLAKFDIALSRNLLITPALRESMWVAPRLADGRMSSYGLGWFLAPHDGVRLAWHTGLWEGQYSALYLKVLSDIPSERFTLILLANSDALRWPSQLDEAAIERSPYAMAFLALRRSMLSR